MGPMGPVARLPPDLVFRAIQDCGDGPVIVLDEGIGADPLGRARRARRHARGQLRGLLPSRGPRGRLPDRGRRLRATGCTTSPATSAPRPRPGRGDGLPRHQRRRRRPGARHPLRRLRPGLPQSERPRRRRLLRLRALHRRWGHLASAAGRRLPGLRPHGGCSSPARATGSESFAPVTVGAYQVYETRRHFEDTHYGDWSPVGDRFWLVTNYNLLSPSTRRAGRRAAPLPGGASSPRPAPEEFARRPSPCWAATTRPRRLRAEDRQPGHQRRSATTRATTAAAASTCAPSSRTPTSASVRVNGDGGRALRHDHGSRGRRRDRLRRSRPRRAPRLVRAREPLRQLERRRPARRRSHPRLPRRRTRRQHLCRCARRSGRRPGRLDRWPFRLTLPVETAFPVPCCYLLRLEARKRTLESCDTDVRNVSEMTLGVGVCDGLLRTEPWGVAGDPRRSPGNPERGRRLGRCAQCCTRSRGRRARGSAASAATVRLRWRRAVTATVTGPVTGARSRGLGSGTRCRRRRP